MVISDKLLKKLFLLYDYRKEVSGMLTGFYYPLNGDYKTELPENYDLLVNDCLFYNNSDSGQRESNWRFNRFAIGYFHSHISGVLKLSFFDKALLFLFWMLGQNLSLVYGKSSDLFVLIFYKFSLNGIKVEKKIEYNFVDLFNQFAQDVQKDFVRVDCCVDVYKTKEGPRIKLNNSNEDDIPN